MSKESDKIKQDRAAENKGRKDYERYADDRSIEGTLRNVVSSPYKPVKGHEESYREGWYKAEQDRKDSNQK
ncbi:MAG TPA: hypothetical protein PLA19_04385 [Candidatus Pacearchaeota archaeon]|nr:hypothetical protein [Candidatus Pacearchaeota archaeon]